MPARPAGRNQHFTPRIQPAFERRKCFGLQSLAIQIQIERPPDGGGLFKDFAKHGVREFVHNVRTFPESRIARSRLWVDFKPSDRYSIEQARILSLKFTTKIGGVILSERGPKRISVWGW